jgi:periplasmic protein TonB
LSGTTSMLDVPLERRRHGAVVAGLGAIVVHGGLVALAIVLGTRVIQRMTSPAPVTQLVEIDLSPRPEEQEVLLQAAPKPTRRAPVPRAAEEPPAPPAAAQAGQVVTAADDIVDFGDTVVVGRGDSYAGGTTEANGTATHAVRDRAARGGGVPAGAGTDLSPDRSRRPSLTAGTEWDCPFPAEADNAGIDHAIVTLRVSIGADGKVLDVRAASDPGSGFAREARACALGKPWLPALDRLGKPAAAVTIVNVRFDRGTD